MFHNTGIQRKERFLLSGAGFNMKNYIEGENYLSLKIETD